MYVLAAYQLIILIYNMLQSWRITDPANREGRRVYNFSIFSL